MPSPKSKTIATLISDPDGKLLNHFFNQILQIPEMKTIFSTQEPFQIQSIEIHPFLQTHQIQIAIGVQPQPPSNVLPFQATQPKQSTYEPSEELENLVENFQEKYFNVQLEIHQMKKKLTQLYLQELSASPTHPEILKDLQLQIEALKNREKSWLKTIRQWMDQHPKKQKRQ